MAFVDSFSDMMPDTLTATPGYTDWSGAFVASGTVLSLACRIEGRARLVRSLSGEEVVSTVQVYVGSYNGLTVDTYRYTLPSRFDPNTDIKAISVNGVTDESGADHEVVILP